MESECNSARKRSYDITMSKRTRKPLSLTSNGTSSEKKIDSIVFDKEEDESDRRSLKQLIHKHDEEEHRKISDDGDDMNDNKRSSLEEHFTEEEKQLQVVRRQNQEGMKLKGMVGRYVKVLSHLIKVKRGQQPLIVSRKKPLPHLPL